MAPGVGDHCIKRFKKEVGNTVQQEKPVDWKCHLVLHAHVGGQTSQDFVLSILQRQCVITAQVHSSIGAAKDRNCGENAFVSLIGSPI